MVAVSRIIFINGTNLLGPIHLYMDVQMFPIMLQSLPDMEQSFDPRACLSCTLDKVRWSAFSGLGGGTTSFEPRVLRKRYSLANRLQTTDTLQHTYLAPQSSCISTLSYASL
jgi:hypothetical protein